MANKRLLKESQIRRFMGLAGMKSTLVSNYLKEGSVYEADEEDADPDALPGEEDAEFGDMDDMEPMGDEEEDADATAAEVNVDESMIADAKEGHDAMGALLDALMPEAVGDELAPVGDEMPDEEMGDMGDDEEILEKLNRSGVQIQESKARKQTRVVNEVAKRVARRIMEAKKAQIAYNKAIGNSPSARRRTTRRRK